MTPWHTLNPPSRVRLDLNQKVYLKNFFQQPAMKLCIPGSAVALPIALHGLKTVVRDDILPRLYPGHFHPVQNQQEAI